MRNQALTVQSEESANSKLNVNVFDIWALGITIVIGGQYFSWNAGLSAGFGSYFISTFLMGSAYICLCYCNAEITSALPFAGGAYGMARVTLGLYTGFIVGCMEAVEYIAYVASSSIFLSGLLCGITATATSMIPLYCLAFFVVTIWIQIAGGRWFWTCSSGLGVASLCILLIYIFGSINWARVENIAASSTTAGVEYSYFTGGVRSFITVTPLAGWWYVGVESLNLSCAFVSNVSTYLVRY
jgi:ethanolamine permease